MRGGDTPTSKPNPEHPTQRIIRIYFGVFRNIDITYEFEASCKFQSDFKNHPIFMYINTKIFIYILPI